MCRELFEFSFHFLVHITAATGFIEFSLAKLIVSHDLPHSVVTIRTTFDQLDLHSTPEFERTMDRCCQVLISRSDTSGTITFTKLNLVADTLLVQSKLRSSIIRWDVHDQFNGCIDLSRSRIRRLINLILKMRLRDLGF